MEVKVVSVIVILWRRDGQRIGQLGPATPHTQGPFPVEVGHRLRAEVAPLRDIVPDDQKREGQGRGRDECPCRGALSRGEEPPGAADRGREHAQTKAAVKSHGAESFSRFPVEAFGALPVQDGGVRDWRLAAMMSRFHA